jgi:hypothetical protein
VHDADPFDSGPDAGVHAVLGFGRRARSAARRALIASAVAWVPLAALAAIQGLAVGPTPGESLLRDAASYARYVVALPLFVLAEGTCLPVLARITRQFRIAGLIVDSDVARYDEILAAVRHRLRHRGVAVAVMLLAYAATIGVGWLRQDDATSTWIMPVVDGVQRRSLAGWWRATISQPLFLMVAVSWVWRLIVWARLMVALARLRLRLIPSHPDLAGGLRFVSLSLPALAIVAFALGAALAGGLLEEVRAAGRAPQDLRGLVLSVVAVLLAISAGPLLVFAPALWRARARGVYSYGRVTESVGGHFEDRWLAASEDLIRTQALGSPDFSSTTDLYSVAANVYAMRLVPFDVRALLPILIGAALPFLPLVATTQGLSALLERLVRLLL